MHNQLKTADINAAAQTAVAAVLALLLARICQLPESFWAPISAIVCSLDAFDGALRVGRRRFLGTALGVTIGALQMSLTTHSLPSYAFVIALLGLVCSGLSLHPSAFRFGAIALTVVVTDTSNPNIWITAATRFVDVSLGILVALIVGRAWPMKPHREEIPPNPE